MHFIIFKWSNFLKLKLYLINFKSGCDVKTQTTLRSHIYITSNSNTFSKCVLAIYTWHNVISLRISKIVRFKVTNVTNARKSSQFIHSITFFLKQFLIVRRFYLNAHLNDCYDRHVSFRISQTSLTRDQGISHPLVPKGGGGSMGHPLRKPLSRWNFVMNTTLYIYTPKTTIFKQTNT